MNSFLQRWLRVVMLTAALVLASQALSAGQPESAAPPRLSPLDDAVPAFDPFPCEPVFDCFKVYTAATYLGRDEQNRCKYRCDYTRYCTNTCTGQTFTSNGYFEMSAGPWTNNYCEPAPDPEVLCSYGDPYPD